MSNQISKTAIRLVATVGLPAILGVALAWQIANRWLTLMVEEGPEGKNSVALMTPWDTLSLRKTRPGASLLQAIRGDSIPIEQTWLDWNGTVSALSGKRQLVVLAFENRANPEQLEVWYQKKLGANFSQTKGWPVAVSKEALTWMRRIESPPQPGAIVFHEELPHRARGVLILPGTEGQDSEIKLYDYMDAGGEETR